jgi:filamentous hemagglutinin family protein
MPRTTNRLLPIPAALRFGVGGALLLLPGFAFANPAGGQVVAGQATITAPAPNGTVVNQSSSSAIVNWQSFNVGSNEYVHFVQPSSSAVVLNRVVGGSASSIFGSISANGRVFLVNPQGVVFAPGARIDVGALVASTMDIRDEDFLAGRYVFSGAGAPGAAIVNDGSIHSADGGFVVLAGDRVENSGIIQAKLGQVVLASGSALTLDVDPSGLVSYAIDGDALSQHAGVDNSGQILADGGRVVMAARTGQDLIDTAVNNSGLVRARGITTHGGTIELTASGGDITDSGTLDTGSDAGSGGSINIRSDRNIDLQTGAQVLADGATHGGKVTVVADGTLNTRSGSLLSARAEQTGGQGGSAELSGHGDLTIRGDLELGAGGSVLIDPENIVIADGSGTSGSDANHVNATVYEQSIENLLRSGTHVDLIATRSITLDALTDGALDGRNGGLGGGMRLGIGTIGSDGKVAGTGGTIRFQDPADSILIDGDFEAPNGFTTPLIGTTTLGNISARSVYLPAGGNISVGNISTRASDAAATTKQDASVVISSAAGTIKAGDISTVGVSGGGDIDAHVALTAGNSVHVGAITTLATVTRGLGQAKADVSLVANSGLLLGAVALGGDIVATGPISTSAVSTAANGGGAIATVAIDNLGGNIDIGDIQTFRSGRDADTSGPDNTLGPTIDLYSNGHDITTGTLSIADASDSIWVRSIIDPTPQLAKSAGSSGDIAIGGIGNAGTTPGALVTQALHSLTFGSGAPALTATSLDIEASQAHLALGALTTTGGDLTVANTGGDLALGALNSARSLTLGTVNALTTGGVSARQDITITGSGNLSLANSAQALDAGHNLLIQSRGALIIGSRDLSGATVNLQATGDLTLNGTRIHGGTSPPAGDGAVLSGANIHLGGSTVVDGGSGTNAAANGVTMTATSGSIDAATNTQVRGNSLSVRAAQNIDLANAAMSIGNGAAHFGQDSTLVSTLRLRAPDLVPSSSTPNASFAAGGTLSLGSLGVAGNYVFAQTPSIDDLRFTAPVNAATGGGALLNFLPANTAGTLQLASASLPAGFSTIAYGGTAQTGNIVVGDGIAVNPPNGNVVIDTHRYIVYPSPLTTRGDVVLIGNVVGKLPSDSDSPVLPENYLPAPADHGSANNGGDENEDGVNDANAGRIDIHTVPITANGCE